MKEFARVGLALVLFFAGAVTFAADDEALDRLAPLRQAVAVQEARVRELQIEREGLVVTAPVTHTARWKVSGVVTRHPRTALVDLPGGRPLLTGYANESGSRFVPSGRFAAGSTTPRRNDGPRLEPAFGNCPGRAWTAVLP